ncbi:MULTISPECIES: nucleoside triphosphate pyrophosphatase [unclassified Sphingomonas]|uniref:Maf family protein n=1 Tax=unclassified Sphingomonas TaxID=196159 RepID=UPI0004DF3210|nr:MULTISPECIES: nucleoside triphosphate pyrophosphatase [unclassified Sphingomonas]MBD8701600.1 septum formation protein Maf [Sphingomonas sp. CFBP 13714]MDY1009771.1 nucleoside triphosphate pyrophosphatase [Sphingomonas sp. CFBP9019]
MVLVLASSSPRRRDLLARLGVVPSRVASPDIDESPHRAEVPRAYALRLAVEKACAVDRAAGEIVIAGDTTIALGRRILPPADTPDIQRDLLGKLSGRRHHCLSAVCVIDAAGTVRTRLADTIVAFKPLSSAEIDDYIACGEGLGKAGGYAIQGRAEAFVRFLSGSHSGVVGLPLFETRALLKTAGLALA